MVENNHLNTEDFQFLDLEVQIPPTSTPDDLYWETNNDDSNQVIYDFEDEELITTPTEQTIIKKIVSRNVGNTRRRRFR